MPGSAFQLSPFAGQSISLRFPLLLLLLSPSPVLPADPGAPAPGRRPLCCPRRAPVLRPWLSTPHPLSPPASPASPFGSRCLGGGRGLSLGGMGALCRPPGVWPGLGPQGVLFAGKGQTGILGGFGKRDRVSPGPLTCSGTPAVPADSVPNNPRCFPCGPLSKEAAGVRGKQAGVFSFSSL